MVLVTDVKCLVSAKHTKKSVMVYLLYTYLGLPYISKQDESRFSVTFLNFDTYPSSNYVSIPPFFSCLVPM